MPISAVSPDMGPAFRPAMRTLRLPILLASILSTAMVVGCQSRRDTFAPNAPFSRAPNELPVALVVEGPGGGQFPMFNVGDAMYVAGEHGAQYRLRLVNNTNERVEAVVTVDGRDVISGELGDFKKQRGYIVQPHSSIPIDGFRRSLQEVAAFRFSDQGGSYSGQRGTPQHVGVIGVALFREKVSRKKPQAYAAAPQPFAGGVAQAPPEPFPNASAAEADAAAPGRDRAAKSAPPPTSAPEAEAGAAEDSAAFQPDPGFDPTPHHELGTQYGESQFSAVSQVEFKRHRKRKPDGFLTVYYDSMQGLQARGIVDPNGRPLQQAVSP